MIGPADQRLFPEESFVGACGAGPGGSTGRTSVYLLYDEGGCLLYVGITSTGTKRFAQHRDDQPWFDDVARADFEHYDTRREALAREGSLIRSLHPIHNKALNVCPGWHRCDDHGRPVREHLAVVVDAAPDPTAGPHCCRWMELLRSVHQAENEALTALLTTPGVVCPECVARETSIREAMDALRCEPAS